jgi:hypothetical protein
MFGNRFYHQTTRRFVAMFGTLFNDIVIDRVNNAGSTVQRMKVPIHYAPMQKILARIEGDPNLDQPAMTLPRMSFEIVNLQYSPERKLTSLTKNVVNSTDPNIRKTQFVPAPYDIEFQLNIMTKYAEDGTKILEQIIPFFKPDVTVSVRLIDELDLFLDVPIILNSVTMDDSYEGEFLTRRSMTWTLSFTVRGYFFGPVESKKIIKFVESNVNDLDGNTFSTLTAQPGLTADGQPTNVLTGIRASATTSVANGQVVSAEIVANGSGYGYGSATAVITAPLTQTAVAGATIEDEKITGVDISTPGGYYSTVPNVIFGPPTLAPKTATAYATANTTSNGLDGTTVLDGGRYYVGIPSLTIQDPPASIQATATTDSISANEITFSMINNGTNYESANATVQYTVLTDTVNYNADSLFTDENVSLVGTETIGVYPGVTISSEPYYEDGFAPDSDGIILLKVPDGSEMTANTDYPIYNGRFYNIGLRKEDNGDINVYHELDPSVLTYVTLDPSGSIYDYTLRGSSTVPLNPLIGQWVQIGVNTRHTSSSRAYYFAAVTYKDANDTYERWTGLTILRYSGMDVVVPIWPNDVNNLVITAPPGSKIEQVHFYKDPSYGDPSELYFDPDLASSQFPDTNLPYPDSLPAPVEGVTVYYTDFENANTTTKTVQTTTNITNFSVSTINKIEDSNIVSVQSITIDAPTAARAAFAFPTVSDGQISGFVFQDVGFGYSFADDFLADGTSIGSPVAEFTIGAPTGAPSNFSAQGTANVVNGEVVGINITTGGLGYDESNPSQVIFDAPTQRTATATVQIDADTKEVSGITITDGGIGYRVPASIIISEPDEVSIPRNEISIDDDWGLIVQIEEG